MIIPIDQRNDCTHIELDDRPGDYFVSAQDAGRHCLASGPYKTHAEAKENVERVKKIIIDRDPKAHFYAFGTSRAPLNSGIVGVIESEEWKQ